MKSVLLFRFIVYLMLEVANLASIIFQVQELVQKTDYVLIWAILDLVSRSFSSPLLHPQRAGSCNMAAL